MLKAEAASLEHVQADIFLAYDALIAVAYGGVRNPRTQVQSETYNLVPAPHGGSDAWYRGEVIIVCPADLDGGRLRPRLEWLRGIDSAPNTVE